MRTSNEILDSIKEIRGIKKDVELARLFGVKPNVLSTWRSRNTIPYQEIVTLCDKLGMSIAAVFGEEPSGKRDEKLEEVEQILQRNPEAKGAILTLLKGVTAQEEKGGYGLSNRQRFWLEAMTQFEQVQGAEHLRRIIYDALRAAHVPVDEIEKRYRY